ncbi:MAG: cobyric acid synthase [Sulfolobaceae archaeon]
MKGLIASTMSDSGKSLLVSGLAKILKMRPLKFQNMSLNSFPSKENEEIAFIQAFQAIGANQDLDTDLNPVLLKPSGNGKVEVILFGRSMGIFSYEMYYDMIETIWKKIRENLAIVDDRIVEGAGSIGEPNFLNIDISSILPSIYYDLPIILILDVERGGAFASAYGVYNMLPPSLRSKLKGFIINKFRGNYKLLEPAVKWLEERTNMKYLGYIPYIEENIIMAEDSMNIHNVNSGSYRIGVIAYPYMSNFNEFSAFEGSNASLEFIRNPEILKGYDIIILPGSKNTLESLKWLINNNFHNKLREKPVIGICGGFQIMAKRLIDPYGLETGHKGEYKGLGIFDVEVIYENEKIVSWSYGEDLENRQEVEGYEIRRGRIKYLSQKPLILISKRGLRDVEVFDGARSGNFIGFSIHGVFYSEFGRELLKEYGIYLKERNLFEHIKEKVNKIEELIKKYLDIDEIRKIFNN